jgi:hypothetical protein
LDTTNRRAFVGILFSNGANTQLAEYSVLSMASSS